MKYREKIDSFLAWTLVIIMSLMVINVLWQVFSRFILGDPSSYTEELARYLMIWVGVLGAAYVSGKNKHVAIDYIPSKFSKTNQFKVKKLVTWIIMIFAFFAFIIGGSRLVYITYILEQFSPALQIPLAFVYLVIPISGILIVYYKINEILNYKA
jgi:TRAP-type C4-dicarboxylate transport system permease small subunit|tara:strand:- start:61 stop:525 length:465 start_codon:yes stop_codon:yes gene_type:complete